MALFYFCPFILTFNEGLLQLFNQQLFHLMAGRTLLAAGKCW